jgi:hypothetical protein
VAISGTTPPLLHPPSRRENCLAFDLSSRFAFSLFFLWFLLVRRLAWLDRQAKKNKKLCKKRIPRFKTSRANQWRSPLRRTGALLLGAYTEKNKTAPIDVRGGANGRATHGSPYPG